MTVDEIVRAWRDPAYLETLTPGERDRIPESPVTSVAVLDRETAPTRVEPWAVSTCDQACGDTCPYPFGHCNNTCTTNANCCC